VEVDQVLPLLGRAALQGDASTRVAAATGFAELGVEMLDRVQPALHGVAHPIGFAGRQALLVGQVLDQRATVVVADLQAVHHLHASDAHQPAFRRFTLVADAAVGIVAFGDMAPHALVLQQARALLGRHGLGAQQRGGDQRQFARMPPESSRLQGQTSTVVVLIVFRTLWYSRCACGRCDTGTVPVAVKAWPFNLLGSLLGLASSKDGQLQRAISRQGVSS